VRIGKRTIKEGEAVRQKFNRPTHFYYHM
jgi:hypothetical protein